MCVIFQSLFCQGLSASSIILLQFFTARRYGDAKLSIRPSARDA